jgi:hypothetical protein
LMSHAQPAADGVNFVCPVAIAPCGCARHP